MLLRHLPPDCSIARAEGSSGLTNADVLLMDLWGIQAGEKHPMYPKPTERIDPERQKRIRAAKVRARERQRAIDAGEIT